MADELDPRLEARLREALHHEADTLPLLVRADDVERARRRRGGSRLALPASLLGLAAVLAILVIVGGAWRANQSIVATSPSASPSSSVDPNQLDHELATYADLEASLVESAPSMPVVARGEHLATGGATGTLTVDVGSVGPFHFLNVAIDCKGGEIKFAIMDGVSETFSGSGACGPHAELWTDGVGSTADVNRIVVTADASVAWRLVASGFGPSISPLPTTASDVLPSYEDLAAYPSSTIELLRKDGAADTAAGAVEFGEVAGKLNLEVVLACTGTGEVRVSVRGGGATSPVGTYGCGAPGVILWTALDPALVAATHASLLVEVPPDTAWRMLVYDHSSALRRYPEAPVLGFDSTLLGRMSGTMTAGETAPVEAPVVSPGATLVVNFGCEGQGLIHLVVDGIARDAACLATNVMEFVPAGTGPSLLEITPEHAVRLNLELRAYTREQAGAAIDVPSAKLATVPSSSAAPGFTTCLTSWRLPDGTTGDEGCGPTWRPIPDGRVIRAGAGEILEAGATDGWTITGIEPFYADNAAVTADATLVDWVPLRPMDGPGVEGQFTLGAPPPGDWAVRLVVTGRLADGTTFTADQAFRIFVEP